MKKGVIIEIKDTHLIMLTDNGEFLHSERSINGDEIGKEILFWPIRYRRNSFSRARKVYATVSIAAVFLLVFAFASPFLMKAKAYAYVSFDINPSIELTIDDKYQVISAIAFNEDGEKVLSHLEDMKNKQFSDAAGLIINQYQIMGYVEAEEKIVIAGVAANKKAEELQVKVASLKPLESSMKVQLEIIEATEKERDLAREQGITAGNYISAKNEIDNKHVPVNQIMDKEVKSSQDEAKKEESTIPTLSPDEKKNQGHKSEERIEKEKKQLQLEESKQKNQQLNQGKQNENRERQKNQGKQNHPENKNKQEEKMKQKQQKEIEKKQRKKEKKNEKAEKQLEKNKEKNKKERNKNQNQKYKEIEKKKSQDK